MSGLRFGVSGSTTRGFGTAEFEQVGDWVAQVLAGLAAKPHDNTATEMAVAEQVRAMTRRFPIYGG
ncbi:MAG: hypothetical protein IIZ92_18190 [Aquincola sp.]|nr:hypothetical protein [Aquincola sp.]